MSLGKQTIILITGKAGVGKTTLSCILRDYINTNLKLNSHIYSFAMKLKECAKFYFGWDGNKDDKGRELLQNIGRVGRIYNKDIWVEFLLTRVWAENLIPPDIVIVDDWRFPNELEYLVKQELYNVVTIRIESPEREILKESNTYEDISETSLPSVFPGEENTMYDYVIHNNGELEELKEKAINIVENILRKEK